MLSLGEFIHLCGFNHSLNANAPNIYVQDHENSPLNVPEQVNSRDLRSVLKKADSSQGTRTRKQATLDMCTYTHEQLAGIAFPGMSSAVLLAYDVWMWDVLHRVQ